MENGKPVNRTCTVCTVSSLLALKDDNSSLPASFIPLCLPPSLPSVVFDGLGDVMKPTVTPQAGDVDTSMANMASSK